MILIINLCNKESELHKREFIKPITDLIEKEFTVKHYTDLIKKDLDDAEKIILSGTPLKEFEYLDNMRANWLTSTTKPVLGICAGAQIITKTFGASLIEQTEMGLVEVTVRKEDKILPSSINQVYSLHTKAFELPKEFDIILESTVPQLVKKNNIYAALFHAEVRNKELITNFINLNL